MDWDAYYIRTGCQTVYWFATGRKPTLPLIMNRVWKTHAETVRGGIFLCSGAFWRHLDKNYWNQPKSEDT